MTCRFSMLGALALVSLVAFEATATPLRQATTQGGVVSEEVKAAVVRFSDLGDAFNAEYASMTASYRTVDSTESEKAWMRQLPDRLTKLRGFISKMDAVVGSLRGSPLHRPMNDVVSLLGEQVDAWRAAHSAFNRADPQGELSAIDHLEAIGPRLRTAVAVFEKAVKEAASQEHATEPSQQAMQFYELAAKGPASEADCLNYGGVILAPVNYQTVQHIKQGMFTARVKATGNIHLIVAFGDKGLVYTTVKSCGWLVSIADGGK